MLPRRGVDAGRLRDTACVTQIVSVHIYREIGHIAAQNGGGLPLRLPRSGHIVFHCKGQYPLHFVSQLRRAEPFPLPCPPEQLHIARRRAQNRADGKIFGALGKGQQRCPLRHASAVGLPEAPQKVVKVISERPPLTVHDGRGDILIGSVKQEAAFLLIDLRGQETGSVQGVGKLALRVFVNAPVENGRKRRFQVYRHRHGIVREHIFSVQVCRAQHPADGAEAAQTVIVEPCRPVRGGRPVFHKFTKTEVLAADHLRHIEKPREKTFREMPDDAIRRKRVGLIDEFSRVRRKNNDASPAVVPVACAEFEARDLTEDPSLQQGRPDLRTVFRHPPQRLRK